MAARNISFAEFSPDIQRLLNQALKAALTQAAELPTMFCLYGDNEEPTQAEIDHATEILRTALTDQTIYYGAEIFIADTLRYVIWDIENWVGGRDEAQTAESSMQEYAVRFGVDITPATLVELKCLARSLCPHSEIGITNRVSLDPADHNLTGCLLAFYKVLDEDVGIDYGQHNMGIVVDGVMFDFPKNHPMVRQVRSLIEDYQVSCRRERAQ